MMLRALIVSIALMPLAGAPAAAQVSPTQS
jgi:hypothetical protein